MTRKSNIQVNEEIKTNVTLADRKNELLALIAEKGYNVKGMRFSREDIIILASNHKNSDKLENAINDAFYSESMFNYYLDRFKNDYRIHKLEQRGNTYTATEMKMAAFAPAEENVDSNRIIDPGQYSPSEVIVAMYMMIQNRDMESLLEHAAKVLGSKYNYEFYELPNGKIEVCEK